ncbi:hypothetical protein [Bradyrhizobium sp.]|uniref:hypothetical protein n=1 Tax=Bradyrhizobium sp. TaxID=376 RepID=UPI003C4C4478
MGENRIIKAVGAALVALAICGVCAPAASQSLSDRFKSLFGGKPDDPAPQAGQQGQPGQPAPDPGLTESQVEDNCPSVTIRAGASTFAVAAPGKQPVGNDVRYQATITRTARECRKNGDDIVARIGIQGRVIAGPAGAPSSVEVPLRIAVVQGGVNEKVIATKAYRTTVEMTEDASVPFSFVADDLVYPMPPGALVDSYIFYIGFDPQLVAPEPKPKAARRKK